MDGQNTPSNPIDPTPSSPSNSSMSARANYMVPASIIIAGVIIAIAIVYVKDGTGIAYKGTGSNTKTGTGAPPPPSQASLDDGNNPVLGDPKAKVTIVEFSDFQCPFCESFWTNTLPQIREKYIKTGKAKLIYRYFPLSSIHPEAEKSAEAAECANEQGKFWDYHDILFGRQAQLSSANYKAWAKELGMNTDQFNTCLDTGKFAADVGKEYSDGLALQVSGTPTFFVNGQQIVGAVPFAQFQTAIDAALAAGQ